MDRLTNTFKQNPEVLNIYFTAGYPNLNDTVKIAKILHQNGVDMIEIGMPYSDPLADGNTIQHSSEVALKNGITLPHIFNQVKDIRQLYPNWPIVLMGYFNQVLQYGIEPFLLKANQCGVDALIIPDLPPELYEQSYKPLFEKYKIKICFLVTPYTKQERMLKISELCTGFLYIVSSTSTTGNNLSEHKESFNYFNKIKDLNLSIPKLIGFGIQNKAHFNMACQYAQGGIIGSAFINALKSEHTLSDNINTFIKTIR